MKAQEVLSIGIKNKFKKKALEIFRFQAEANPIYSKYIAHLKTDVKKVKHLEQIPFLPIEFFKTQKVITETAIGNPQTTLFLSSGTTGVERSKHYVTDVALYKKAFRKGFKKFYGDIKKYVLLAYLPSYYENKNSSLLYMVNDLMKDTGRNESRFYKAHEHQLLFETIPTLLLKKKKVILLGVSYALLDLTHQVSPSFYINQEKNSNFIIMETGGMKGKRKEITRKELHHTLSKKFGVPKIHSEYGMTELLSQAYSLGDGKFSCPPWMKVLIRDANDPFAYFSAGKTGALNIIDLANIYSCAFVATQDLGKLHKNGSFEVLGRMDNSDLRGCNLLAEH